MPRQLRWFFTSIILLTACAQSQQRADLIRFNGAGWSAVTYPAQVRGAYMLDKNSVSGFCAEPVPDVAMDTVSKVMASVEASIPETATVGAEIDASTAATAVQLAGRSELVLLVRELLYRLCEMSLNHKTESKMYKEIAGQYQDVINLIVMFARTDQAYAEKELVDAQARAGVIVNERSTNIGKIIKHLLSDDGSLDKKNLEDLEDKVPSLSAFHHLLVDSRDQDTLKNNLLLVPHRTLDQAADAIDN